MTILAIVNAAGFMECSECGAVFYLCWNRNPEIEGIEFCPFCGEDVEGVEGHPEDFEEGD